MHLVDTPGFDDNRRSDVDVLWEVVFWLNQAHEAGIRLGGIIYLHRIIDFRLSGSALRSLRAFKKLCGRSTFPGAAMLTTFWEAVDGKDDMRAQAEARLRELETTDEFWGDILAGGGKSRALRSGREEALQVVDELVRQGHRLCLAVQLEMAGRSQIHLSQTGVGRVLYDTHRLEASNINVRMDQVKVELTDALRRHHDVNTRELRQHQKALLRDLEAHTKMLSDLDTPVWEVVASGMKQAESERAELTSLASSAPSVDQDKDRPKTAFLAQAIRKLHIPSMTVEKKVELGAALVSASTGVAALAVTTAACTIM